MAEQPRFTQVNINRAEVGGNLIADPVLHNNHPSGTPMVTFSIVSCEKFMQNGVAKVIKQHHKIVVFGKQGIACYNYLCKGAGCIVWGRINTRTFRGRDGDKMIYEVIARDVDFQGPGKQDAPQPSPQPDHTPTHTVRKVSTPEQFNAAAAQCKTSQSMLAGFDTGNRDSSGKLKAY